MQALQKAGVLIPDGDNPRRIDEYKYLLYLSHTNEQGELTCPLFAESKYHSGNPDVNGRTLNELINAVSTSTNLYFISAENSDGDEGEGIHTVEDNMRLVTEKLQSLQETVAHTTEICMNSLKRSPESRDPGQRKRHIYKHTSAHNTRTV